MLSFLLLATVGVLVVGLIVVLVIPRRKQPKGDPTVLDMEDGSTMGGANYSTARTAMLAPLSAEHPDDFRLVIDFPEGDDFGCLCIFPDKQPDAATPNPVYFSSGSPTVIGRTSDGETHHKVERLLKLVLAQEADFRPSNHEIPIPSTGGIAFWLVTKTGRKVVSMTPREQSKLVPQWRAIVEALGEVTAQFVQ